MFISFSNKYLNPRFAKKSSIATNINVTQKFFCPSIPASDILNIKRAERLELSMRGIFISLAFLPHYPNDALQPLALAAWLRPQRT